MISLNLIHAMYIDLNNLFYLFSILSCRFVGWTYLPNNNILQLNIIRTTSVQRLAAIASEKVQALPASWIIRASITFQCQQILTDFSRHFHVICSYGLARLRSTSPCRKSATAIQTTLIRA